MFGLGEAQSYIIIIQHTCIDKMADGSNHYPGRSFIRKGQDPTLHDNPQRMRGPRIGHEPHTAVPIRAFRHRPNNVRAADVLGHDSGASNLAEYATEPNRYDLPAWMVEDIHTLGPINAQLKWKRQKDEVKMYDSFKLTTNLTVYCTVVDTELGPLRPQKV